MRVYRPFPGSRWVAADAAEHGSQVAFNPADSHAGTVYVRAVGHGLESRRWPARGFATVSRCCGSAASGSGAS